MAFLVIHIPEGLSGTDRKRAAESGPDFADAPGPYTEMIRQTGFGNVVIEDVTADYHRTVSQWLEAAADLEEGLRRALGEEAFEDRQANRRSAQRAVEAGLLRRILVIGEAV